MCKGCMFKKPEYQHGWSILSEKEREWGKNYPMYPRLLSGGDIFHEVGIQTC